MNFIDPKLLEYCEEHSSEEAFELKELARQTHLRQINPRMLSGHLQGELLKILTLLIQPTNVLEIGTFTGYSAICIAKQLKPGAHLHTLEVDEELREEILSNFEKAGVSDQTTLHIGNALEIIPSLASNLEFDLVFIDADKENYPQYFTMLKKNLRSGAVFIADNVLWSGKVLHREEGLLDTDTAAIHAFNEAVAKDPEFEKVMLPIRDGITIARKK